jgi:hypothetical protein
MVGFLLTFTILVNNGDNIFNMRIILVFEVKS